MNNTFQKKIHALTVPRVSENSRVKDLVDLYIIFKFEKIDSRKLNSALQKTFERRDTHKIPEALFVPPKNWEKSFNSLISQFDKNINIDEAFTYVNDKYKNNRLKNTLKDFGGSH